MSRMMNRNWKGGKHPCSCCVGGPIPRGRAREKSEYLIEVSREQFEAILSDEPSPELRLVAFLAGKNE